MLEQMKNKLPRQLFKPRNCSIAAYQKLLNKAKAENDALLAAERRRGIRLITAKGEFKTDFSKES